MRVLGALLVLVACAPEEASTEGPADRLPPTCAPGEAPTDAGCLPAGMQPNGCAAGEVALERGGCVAPGVDVCADGFVKDGAGCRAVLPEEPCAPGLMAIPGETRCRAVVTCGGIPVDIDTQYVDVSFAGDDSDGSALKPWKTIQAGIDAAAAHAIVAIAPGSYAENPTITGAVTLWGECGAEIAGTITIAADGTELHALTVTGALDGIFVDGAEAVLDGVWVHDTSGWGVSVVGGSLVMTSSLIEGAYERGVYLEGADGIVEESVVRDTVAAPLSAALGGGRGINVRDHLVTGARSTIALRRSVVERSKEIAVMIHESDGLIDATVVRDSLPSLEGRAGRGIVAQIDPATRTLGHVAIRGSVVERCHDGGIVASGNELSVESTTVRDIVPNRDQGNRGYGIASMAFPEPFHASRLEMRASLIERASEAGIFAPGADVDLHAVVVRDTRANDRAGPGRGISVQGEGERRASMRMTSSVVDGGFETGLYARGGDVTLEGIAVRDIAPRGDGYFGRAISVEERPTPLDRASLTVRWSHFENVHDAGIFCSACDAVVESTAIVDVHAMWPTGFAAGIAAQPSLQNVGPASLSMRWSRVERAQGCGLALSSLQGQVEATLIRSIAPTLDDTLGDGISAFSFTEPVSVTISNGHIDNAARAGISLWGGDMLVSGTELSCNSLHLASEPYLGTGGSLTDGGENVCGCDGVQVTCKAISMNLAPPQPFSPLE